MPGRTLACAEVSFVNYASRYAPTPQRPVGWSVQPRARGGQRCSRIRRFGPNCSPYAGLGERVLQRFERQPHALLPRLVRGDRLEGVERIVRLASLAAERALGV